MIIILGQDQAFVEPFAKWLQIRGHVVEVDLSLEESSVYSSGDDYSLDELFDEFSEGN